ncbi:MAG: hypothetical protein LBF42_00640 [Puniceicoccales bacterium]|nr:hypothetical protein [Puniceicoccales bacterium]
MPRAISVYKKEDIVYVDESGIDRHLHRRNARSAKEKNVRTTRRAVPVDKKEDIVYVDKSGIDRHLHRRNARSAKRKKVFGFVAGKKFHRRNIVAGYVNGKIIAECIYNCCRMCL